MSKGGSPLTGQHGKDVSLRDGKNAEQLRFRGEMSQQTQFHLAEVYNNRRIF